MLTRDERKKEFPHDNYRPALLEIYPDAALEDWYDPWGVTIGLLFDVCGEMYNRGLDIPGVWQFSPGAIAGKAEVRDEGITELSDVLLTNLGHVLHDYVGALEEAGLDY